MDKKRKFSKIIQINLSRKDEARAEDELQKQLIEFELENIRFDNEKIAETGFHNRSQS